MNAPTTFHRLPEQPNPKRRKGPIRVMVVDDSLTARTVLGKVIDRSSDMVLADTASSAEQAIAKLNNGLKVEVILLDLEMPGIGGLAGLPEILEKSNNASVLVVSSLTAEGAKETIAALSMGASDVVQKPEPGKFNAEYRAELAGRIRALAGGAIPRANEDAREQPSAVVAPTIMAPRQVRIDCIAIGGSTGGIHSLCQFFAELPKSIATPIVITQHLPSAFVQIFADQMESAASRPARIAQNGSRLVPGEILIAPGDGHLSFVKEGRHPVAKITNEAVASGCCPSVDPMLGTLAEALDGNVAGVVLSGMGRDGQFGAKKLVEQGGIMLAECAETSAVWGMPRGVAEAGIASEIAAPGDLAKWLSRRLAVAV